MCFFPTEYVPHMGVNLQKVFEMRDAASVAHLAGFISLNGHGQNGSPGNLGQEAAAVVAREGGPGQEGDECKVEMSGTWGLLRRVARTSEYSVRSTVARDEATGL